MIDAGVDASIQTLLEKQGAKKVLFDMNVARQTYRDLRSLTGVTDWD